MSKRLTDTEIWKKDWFLDLPDKQKLLVKFLYDNCNCAGIYEISMRTLKYSFSEEITLEDFKKLKQVKFISEKKIFIEDFIPFQYGVTIENLNPKFSVHKGVLRQLDKNGLLTVSKPFEKGYNVTVKDKDKDKDIDKNINTNISKIDIYSNIYKDNFIKKFKEIFGNSPFLSNLDCRKIVELSTTYSQDIIETALIKLKKINFEDIGFKPSANWLLKDNNFERVMNGEFDKEEKEETNFKY